MQNEPKEFLAPIVGASENQASLRHAAQCELLTEIVRSHGEARLRVTGTSMLPSIFPGDMIAIRREEMSRVLPGDIVLFARRGRLYAHRVVNTTRKAGRPVLTTRGDWLRHNDHPVSPEELLGRVALILRGQSAILPKTTWARWRRLFLRCPLFRSGDWLTGIVLRLDALRKRMREAA